MTRDERIATIVATLRPTDPASWPANIQYVTAEFDAHDAAQCQRITELEEEQKVAEHITDSFWAALKLLNLSSLDVQNPGRHFTERIAELEAEVARWKQEAQWAAAEYLVRSGLTEGPDYQRAKRILDAL